MRVEAEILFTDKKDVTEFDQVVRNRGIDIVVMTYHTDRGYLNKIYGTLTEVKKLQESYPELNITLKY